MLLVLAVGTCGAVVGRAGSEPDLRGSMDADKAFV